MIPPEPGTALGCGWQLVRTHRVRHFPHCAPSAHPSSLLHHTHLSTAHFMCPAQARTLLSLRLPSQSWPRHLVKCGKKKRKTVRCEQSPASKALGPAPCVRSELPSQGREPTREGSVEETLNFPLGGSSLLLFCRSSSSKVSQWSQGTAHSAHGLCWELRLHNREVKGMRMCIKHKTPGNTGRNWFPLSFFSYFSLPSYIFSFPSTPAPSTHRCFKHWLPLL